MGKFNLKDHLLTLLLQAFIYTMEIKPKQSSSFPHKQQQ